MVYRRAITVRQQGKLNISYYGHRKILHLNGKLCDEGKMRLDLARLLRPIMKAASHSRGSAACNRFSTSSLLTSFQLRVRFSTVMNVRLCIRSI
jgi:hypothetical protein